MQKVSLKAYVMASGPWRLRGDLNRAPGKEGKLLQKRFCGCQSNVVGEVLGKQVAAFLSEGSMWKSSMASTGLPEKSQGRSGILLSVPISWPVAYHCS
jgi:hypothetical protein